MQVKLGCISLCLSLQEGHLLRFLESDDSWNRSGLFAPFARLIVVGSEIGNADFIRRSALPTACSESYRWLPSLHLMSSEGARG